MAEVDINPGYTVPPTLLPSGYQLSESNPNEIKKNII